MSRSDTQPTIPLVLLVTAMLLALAPVAGHGQASDPTPTGAAVLDRYVEASGGAAAWAAVRTRVVTGRLVLPGPGLELRLSGAAARPNRFALTLESDATGQVQRGCTGEVAWEQSTMGGPRLLAGQEATDTMRDARIDGLVAWRDLYTASEQAAGEDVGGKAAFKVVLTPKDGGNARTWWFDAASGLPVKMEATVATPGGSVTAQALLSDFRPVGGVLVEHRRETTALGQTRIMVMDSIQHNVELPADRFDPPPAVRELIAARAVAPAK
ncbi:MAG: hypothetical protein AB2L07_08070 [Thermoanaerobaculaceae bacterium]